MNYLKMLGNCLLAVLAIGIISFALNTMGIVQIKVFGTAMENARREVFEETKSYNQGMSQDISNFQQQYILATPEQKEALASIILHRTADYDVSKLPTSSRAFIEKLRRGER